MQLKGREGNQNSGELDIKTGEALSLCFSPICLPPDLRGLLINFGKIWPYSILKESEEMSERGIAANIKSVCAPKNSLFNSVENPTGRSGLCKPGREKYIAR